MNRYPACKTSQVAPDGILNVEIPGHGLVAIFNVEGAFFATAGTCTHGEARLSDGMVLGAEVVCPLHGGAFDIRTGAPTASPCVVPLRTYPVVVEGDQVYVGLDPA